MRWLALLFISFEALGQGLPGGERVEFGGIFGDFFRPASNGKAPAIVIVHGSGGVTAAREGFWAGELTQAGMAALVTDSFTPPGVSTTVEDKTRGTTAQMAGGGCGGRRRPRWRGGWGSGARPPLSSFFFSSRGAPSSPSPPFFLSREP